MAPRLYTVEDGCVGGVPFAVMRPPERSAVTQADVAFAGGDSRFSGLQSAPDAMVIVDADGANVLVNSQPEKLFPYPRDIAYRLRGSRSARGL
jgi:PAS domain-containing protein